MPCSCCHVIGHNYLTCPLLTNEEKLKIKSEKVKKMQEAKKKKEEKKKQIEKQKKEHERNRMRDYTIINNNMYEVVVYWGWDSKHVDPPKELHRIKYIGPMKSSIIKANHNHRITIFPFLEVVSPNNDSYDNNPGSAYKKIYDRYGSDNGRVKVVDIEMVNYPFLEIEIKMDYSPPKSELDQWKETALKSYYIIDQIVKISGAFKPNEKSQQSVILNKAQDNLEPLYDIVQDIKIPDSCTEADKEKAGIPSTLTNIT